MSNPFLPRPHHLTSVSFLYRRSYANQQLSPFHFASSSLFGFDMLATSDLISHQQTRALLCRSVSFLCVPTPINNSLLFSFRPHCSADPFASSSWFGFDSHSATTSFLLSFPHLSLSSFSSSPLSSAVLLSLALFLSIFLCPSLSLFFQVIPSRTTRLPSICPLHNKSSNGTTETPGQVCVLEEKDGRRRGVWRGGEEKCLSVSLSALYNRPSSGTTRTTRLVGEGGRGKERKEKKQRRRRERRAWKRLSVCLPALSQRAEQRTHEAEEEAAAHGTSRGIVQECETLPLPKSEEKSLPKSAVRSLKVHRLRANWSGTMNSGKEWVRRANQWKAHKRMKVHPCFRTRWWTERNEISHNQRQTGRSWSMSTSFFVLLLLALSAHWHCLLHTFISLSFCPTIIIFSVILSGTQISFLIGIPPCVRFLSTCLSLTRFPFVLSSFISFSTLPSLWIIFIRFVLLRDTNFLPHRYPSLRSVPLYPRSIHERFERCLDLYLCPRARKRKVSEEEGRDRRRMEERAMEGCFSIPFCPSLYPRPIHERFERCLDLYLCPRARKRKVRQDKEWGEKASFLHCLLSLSTRAPSVHERFERCLDLSLCPRARKRKSGSKGKERMREEGGVRVPWSTRSARIGKKRRRGHEIARHTPRREESQEDHSREPAKVSDRYLVTQEKEENHSCDSCSFLSFFSLSFLFLPHPFFLFSSLSSSLFSLHFPFRFPCCCCPCSVRAPWITWQATRRQERWSDCNQKSCLTLFPPTSLSLHIPSFSSFSYFSLFLIFLFLLFFASCWSLILLSLLFYLCLPLCLIFL